jgi:hypothetical protein
MTGSNTTIEKGRSTRACPFFNLQISETLTLHRQRPNGTLGIAHDTKQSPHVGNEQSNFQCEEWTVCDCAAEVAHLQFWISNESYQFTQIPIYDTP